MYSKVDPDSRSRDLRAAVELLERAGVVHRVCSTSGAGLPLGAEADDRHYKLVMVDVGLMQNLSGATEQLLDGDPMRINDGAVAEQFVGQELLAHRSRYERPELFYWRRRQKNSSAEVDYLVAAGRSRGAGRGQGGQGRAVAESGCLHGALSAAGRGARLRRSPSSGRRLGIGPALRSGAPAALPGRDDRSGSGGHYAAGVARDRRAVVTPISS